MKKYLAIGALIGAGIVSLSVHAQRSRMAQIVEPKATVIKNEDIAESNPGGQISAQAITAQTVIFSQTRLKAGALSPHHNHPEEELIVVISGRLRAKTSDGDVIMEPGDVFVIESYAVHQVEALEDTYMVEAFGAGNLISSL